MREEAQGLGENNVLSNSWFDGVFRHDGHEQNLLSRRCKAQPSLAPDAASSEWMGFPERRISFRGYAQAKLPGLGGSREPFIPQTKENHDMGENDQWNQECWQETQRKSKERSHRCCMLQREARSREHDDKNVRQSSDVPDAINCCGGGTEN